MTLQQLRYAIGIADSPSFNKAAEKLYISQPSLTAAIHELEEEIGIVIFNRTSRGVTLTSEGETFIAYARDLYRHYESLLGMYGRHGKRRQRFSVSTQHYSFAVKSFVEMAKKVNAEEYDLAISETKTREVVLDVSNLKSEIGILYLSDFNRKVLGDFLEAKDCEFHRLIECKAFVYLWKSHPLAGKKFITFRELAPYPCLSFEQGNESVEYYAEEILSTKEYSRTIRANDRATMLNLMIGLNGYTLCSGIICEELNGSDYIAVPFRDPAANKDVMEIGYITKKNMLLSSLGECYIRELKAYLGVEPV